MSLLDLLADNPTTIIRYSIFFAILAVTLPFFGHLGRLFPKFKEKRNLSLAKIFGIIALIGIILTVSVSFLFISVKVDFISFEFFAVVTFVVPLVLGPAIAYPFYLTRSSSESALNVFRVEGRVINNRNGAEMFIIYAAFGIVASNFHDILWCGEKTSWFTVTGFNGYELEIWVNIVGANTYDYVFFGFFMFLHVLFCGIFATFMLWRYARRSQECLMRNPNTRRAFVLAWLGALLWGYGLYLMDSSSRQSSVAWIVGTFIWIPLGTFILGFSARYLSNFELDLPKIDNKS